MYSNEIKEIAADIGQFFLDKNKGDYLKTKHEIENMRVNSISIDDNKVIIELSRPGLLIGWRGEQIHSLIKHLERDVRIVETPNHIEDYLIPYHYNDEDYQ